MDILLPKQVLYQAELCPDTREAQSLRAFTGAGQPGSSAKGGTIRQQAQQSPEHVPTRGGVGSRGVRVALASLYNSPPPLPPMGRATV